jgi:sigma-B regulation protein RsbU (phosphoserine phosphatase)
MPAALYMALTRSLLRAEAARSRSPADVLQRVNRLLQELGRPELFVTIFYAVIQRSTLRLAYARAGHDRPLLLRGKALRELDGDGIPLGLFLEAEFRLEECSLHLEPGDRLLLYTDGLCDALDPHGQDFGRPRLLSLLQAAAGLEPHALCREVLERIGDFQAGAEQYDDITLLALRVL